MQLSDKTKKIAMSVSAIALAMAMGIQTFFFGQNDLQKLQADVKELSLRLENIEDCCGR